MKKPLILAFPILQASSLVIDYTKSGLSPLSDGLPSHQSDHSKWSQLGPRANTERKYCGPPVVEKGTTCCGKPKLQSRTEAYLDENRSVNPASLWRRMLLPGPTEDIGGWIDLHVLTATNRLINRLSPASADWGLAKFELFDNNTPGRRQFSYSLNGLEGCTSLIIINDLGVYLTHWWEMVSFADPNPKNPAEKRGAKAKRAIYREIGLDNRDDVFDATVIKALSEGYTRPRPSSGGNVLPDQTPLLGVAADTFRRSPNGFKAFLIVPDREDEYGHLWREIKSKVTEILSLPEDVANTDWLDEVEYDVEPVTPISGKGRAIFQYDSEHPRGDGTTVRKAVLFFEGEKLYDEEWP
ncbi:hypothetical protein TWF730_001813 [Orbilia blumenaviensis]|uniref:Uncharacterized protein n=1 Tax=Orbilia blumenaviensis TaxID=1796055 RepID=A0AAV9UH58_9PEZI